MSSTSLSAHHERDPALSYGHALKGSQYSGKLLELYAGPGGGHGLLGQAFTISGIAESFETLVPGKRVLDVGCGIGDWCCLAAQYGAKSVDGFDIRPEMVELAKQATSHLQDVVHIQVGDAADMPYDDDSFDVAITLYVACNLPIESYVKYFKELYRVLVPDGKAIILNPNDWCQTKLYTRVDADPDIVEDEITQILQTVPRYPTTAQVTAAFKDADDVLIACFALDKNGKLFHVTAQNVNQLEIGQPVWNKTELTMFPNFFYSDRLKIEQLHSAGFHIDQIVSYCTKERRLAYNKEQPAITLSNDFITHPPFIVHYVSKSTY